MITREKLREIQWHLKEACSLIDVDDTQYNEEEKIQRALVQWFEEHGIHPDISCRILMNAAGAVSLSIIKEGRVEA